MKRKIKLFLLRFDLERLLTLGYISKVPQRQLVFGYLSYIVMGTLLLMLPFAVKKDVGVLDHVFTITSAVSTTGLGTVIVSDVYTFFGQLVILLMIQLGGLGYMTMSSYFMYRMTHHFMRIKSGVLQVGFSMPTSMDMKNLLHNIIAFTLSFELLGALALYLTFLSNGTEQPLWGAVFHSISAFCTAGFSIYPSGLEDFKGDVSVNLIIAVLSYAGAMGFIVMTDLWKKIWQRGYQVTFTSKIIVFITALITVVGTLQIFLLEPALNDYSVGDRLLISFFQTMSAMTTVGFSTVPLGGWVTGSLMILMVAMYIGASPSGTGGGLKSTTASAAFAYVRCKLGMRRHIYLMGRRLPSFRVENAVTTFIFYTAILFLGVYALAMWEELPFSGLLFEAVSALGTVGLTTGVTYELSFVGKIIIILLMFVGRVGVLTVGNAMLIRMKHAKSKHNTNEEDIAV